jgi:hypothetical protein
MLFQKVLDHYGLKFDVWIGMAKYAERCDIERCDIQLPRKLP